jgi:hypothetical protein
VREGITSREQTSPRARGHHFVREGITSRLVVILKPHISGAE